MTLSISFRERPEGWPVLAPPGIRLVGPVIPVRSVAEGIVGFAYATLDTLAGVSRGNLIGIDGKPFEGWPVELPRDRLVRSGRVRTDVAGAFRPLFPNDRWFDRSCTTR